MKRLLLKGYERIVTLGGGGDFTTLNDIKTFITDGLQSVFIKSSDKGKANGIASLDSTGKVPLSQLPSGSGGGGGGGGFALLEYNPEEYKTVSNVGIANIYGNLGDDIRDFSISSTLPLFTEPNHRMSVTDLPVGLVGFDVACKKVEIPKYDTGIIEIDVSNVLGKDAFVLLLDVDSTQSNSFKGLTEYSFYSWLHYDNLGTGEGSFPPQMLQVSATKVEQYSSFPNEVVLDFYKDGAELGSRTLTNLTKLYIHKTFGYQQYIDLLGLNNLTELKDFIYNQTPEQLNGRTPSEFYDSILKLRVIEVKDSADNILASTETSENKSINLYLYMFPCKDIDGSGNTFIPNSSLNSTSSIDVLGDLFVDTFIVPEGLADGTYLKFEDSVTLGGYNFSANEFAQVYDGDKIIPHRN